MTRRARLIRRVLLFGTLGLLTNVAVAWSILWLSTPGYTSARIGRVRIDNDQLAVIIDDSITKTHITLMHPRWPIDSHDLGEPWAQEHSSDWLPSWSCAHRDELRDHTRADSQHGGSIAREYAFGWPWRTVCHHFVFTTRPSELGAGRGPALVSRPVQVLIGGVALTNNAGNLGNRGVLPLDPVMPGFVLGAIAYGSAWAILFLAPTKLIRMLRQKHELWACPRCGYDLRGLAPSAPCPECGTPRTRITVAADHLAPI